MTFELLMSATLGLAFTTVALFFVWRSGLDRRKHARLQAQYALYAARDRVIMLAAAGKLDPESKLFAGLVDWINLVIALDKEADFHFYRWVIQTGTSPEAQESAQEMVSGATGPNLGQDEVIALVTQIGKAVHDVVRSNSRMLRVIDRVQKYSTGTGPTAPDPKNVGSVGLTAPALGDLPAFG